MSDVKLLKFLGIILLLPLTLAYFSGDRFRYPCQDPSNWDKDFCQMPLCDVTRTCPEHIFKGQRDPRLGPPKDAPAATPVPPVAPASSTTIKGDNCGK
jgi:hypothetical protein